MAFLLFYVIYGVPSFYTSYELLSLSIPGTGLSLYTLL
jgi:hypothetical protein